jgi:hypothetical protein
MRLSRAPMQNSADQPKLVQNFVVEMSSPRASEVRNFSSDDKHWASHLAGSLRAKGPLYTSLGQRPRKMPPNHPRANGPTYRLRSPNPPPEKSRLCDIDIDPPSHRAGPDFAYPEFRITLHAEGNTISQQSNGFHS